MSQLLLSRMDQLARAPTYPAEMWGDCCSCTNTDNPKLPEGVLADIFYNSATATDVADAQ